MSNVESSLVISKSRSTVGFAHASTIAPRTRVTRRSPLSSTLRPVESMKSTPVRSRITPVLPPAIASFRGSSVRSKLGASKAISADTNGRARSQGDLQREPLVGVVQYPAEPLAQSGQSVADGL